MTIIHDKGLVAQHIFNENAKYKYRTKLLNMMYVRTCRKKKKIFGLCKNI